MRRRTLVLAVSCALLVALLPVPGAAFAFGRGAAVHASSVTANRIGGSDRYNTAIAVAESTFTTGAASVVVASGLNPSDPLLAASLAGAVGGPVLLTPPTSLPSGCVGEISHLAATQALVVGDETSVSAGVFTAPSALTGMSAVRYGGADAVGTAIAVAQAVKAKTGSDWGHAAFFVSVDSPDYWRTLVAVAPYAYSRRMPVLLTHSADVPPATLAAITGLGITDGVLVANSFDVSDGVRHDLASRCTLAEVTNRGPFGPSVDVADYAVSQGWASYGYVGIASANNFPDCLAAPELVARKGGVLLTTDRVTLSWATQAALYTHVGDVGAVDLFGSSSVMSESLRAAIDAWVPAPAGGAIAGSIVASGTGTHLRDVDVAVYGLYPADANVTFPLYLAAESRTASDGTYALGGLAPGSYWVVFSDPAGAYVSESYPQAPPTPTHGPALTVTNGTTQTADAALMTASQWSGTRLARIAGTDRYDTSLCISRAGFVHATTVVVATGAGFADALSASALAGVYQGPLLLTRPDSLPGGFLAELDRLGTTNVIIVGGEKAVSSGIESQLAATRRTVTRLKGDDRYVTAAAVYEAVAAKSTSANRPFIVRGDAFPDALAAAPFAYSQTRPILLVTPKYAPSATTRVFGRHYIDHVIIVGGTAAVPGSVMQQLANAGQAQTLYAARV
jgi:putative cell wall-binding protein